MELIGKGGSCKVYKVQALDSGTIYAMKKVAFEGEDECAVEGYKNEIQLLNTLEGNKSIIRLIASEIIESKELLYMIMEYGECDLSHLVKPDSQLLTMKQISTFWKDMLKSVEAIHALNIIHSDLKPAVHPYTM